MCIRDRSTWGTINQLLESHAREQREAANPASRRIVLTNGLVMNPLRRTDALNDINLANLGTRIQHMTPSPGVRIQTPSTQPVSSPQVFDKFARTVNEICLSSPQIGLARAQTEPLGSSKTLFFMFMCLDVLLNVLSAPSPLIRGQTNFLSPAPYAQRLSDLYSMTDSLIRGNLEVAKPSSVGIYTCQERSIRIAKYKNKIKKFREAHPVNRTFTGRSQIAVQKPRIKGRFVKNSSSMAPEVENKTGEKDDC
eukprot:TRINITY_DN4867_c0_g2_i5.p1 TRINITY_DN4867_c0_g2~~TRINITY_DN4867_c0_g2_i5.p1  ORF type:complete len:272 (-),score=45.19 TRINITY_DN4867_c0_g2_i5:107-862(-)